MNMLSGNVLRCTYAKSARGSNDQIGRHCLCGAIVYFKFFSRKLILGKVILSKVLLRNEGRLDFITFRSIYKCGFLT